MSLTFSIFVLGAEDVLPAQLEGAERRERAALKLPAAETLLPLRLLPEAGSSANREEAPRGDSLHDSLAALSPPPVHPSVGPLSAEEQTSVTFRFFQLCCC